MSQKSQDKPGGNTKTPGPLYQQYRWCITLPYEETTASQLSQHLKSFCKKFTYQAEKAESGFQHWQIEISLNNKEYFASVKNLIGFDKAHIEPTKNYFAAKNYCSKQDTRIEGPYNEKSVFIKTITTLRKWQQNIVNIIKEEPDDRSIYWYWEKTGNIGKSVFCKYLAVHHEATIFNNGKFSDLAFAIPDNPKIIVFDLPRQSEERFNYSAVEAIKNGMIFSGKYESKTKIFNSPHVLIFANYEPDKSAMSKDRWKITEIN